LSGWGYDQILPDHPDEDPNNNISTTSWLLSLCVVFIQVGMPTKKYNFTNWAGSPAITLYKNVGAVKIKIKIKCVIKSVIIYR
jgi:hypothetical protein